MDLSIDISPHQTAERDNKHRHKGYGAVERLQLEIRMKNNE